jgi:exonuclease SbcC
MQLHRLRLVNFRQHADTDLVLGPGLTAIIGPNGSGKTTLLEAIAWGFYGTPAVRGNRDGIRWVRAPARSPVRVEVEFSLGPDEFRVVRGLYSAELYRGRGGGPIANSQQEVSNRIERLLGMSREEFFSTYFTGQKELAVMARMGPTDRARFLSRILGYERLRSAQVLVRERRNVLRAELTGLERGLVDLDHLRSERERARARAEAATAALEAGEAARNAAASRVEAAGPAWTRAVERRERALSLDGERRIAERDVAEARREFERLDQALAEALSARAKLEELRDELGRVDPLREELARLEREAQSADRRRLLVGQLTEVAEQYARAVERRAAIGDADAALAAARQALDDARVELTNAEEAEQRARTAWVRDKQDAQTKRLNLRDQYLDHQRHRDSVLHAGADGECPICKRPLGEVYGDVLATLERQLEEIEVRGKFFRSRVEQLDEPPPEVMESERRVAAANAKVEAALGDVARAEDRVRELRETDKELARLEQRRLVLDQEVASLPDRYDAERYNTVRAELSQLEPVIGLATELRVRASQAETLVDEAEQADRVMSEREARYESLEKAIADLGYVEAEYLEVRRQYEEAQQALRQAELAVVGLQADVRNAREAVEGADRRIAEREQRAQRVAELVRDVALHDALDEALQGLRTELNGAMRPELSERASDLLSALTDGRYDELDLDEQYNVTMLEEGKPKPVISGGEEDMANLVLRLAISQMVAERAGQPLSLLVLDEIFGSLDEYRQHGVVQLLRGLADRFPQVILITHVEAVRDGVDRVVRVELDRARGCALVTEDRGQSGVAA